MLKQIDSLQNPLIKEIFQLKEKSRVRKRTKRFIIEGQREISLALKGNYIIEKILFDKNIISPGLIQDTYQDLNIECIQISPEIYKKLTYRNTTEGVIAITEGKSLHLNSLVFKNKNPLILIVEAPEKPGNIGALLRTADAANVAAVIIANPKTDLYNPNIIRSSVGCIFTNQIGLGSTKEIISFLKDNGISIYCAALQDDSELYHTQDFKNSTAIVVGTEATGLSDEWLQNATKNIIIPMQGAIDSMNVSVAAGILIFEAKRQRNFI
jgi:TrmH family RNA methyltransferase|tara:strand:- start:56361 stop:57164 length:804 start_codon:yes stop_codon:yes gene_type:complete